MEHPATFSAARLVLCILDGWGEAPKAQGNAVRCARAPTWRKLCRSPSQCLLQASGEAVGLPRGQVGNSEVGHIHIGAGRLVKQSLQRINESIDSGDFVKNPTWQILAEKLRATKGTLHIMTLLSSGGVHSHEDHCAAVLEVFAERKIPTRLHAFLDGRDGPMRAARQSVPSFLARCKYPPRLSSLSGRFYAMDRDCNWQRTQQAWQAVALAQAETFATAAQAIAESYARGVEDEFFVPRVLSDYRGIAAGDGVFFANFRADRMRQLAASFFGTHASFPACRGFSPLQAIGSMTPYGKPWEERMEIAFPTPSLEHCFGACLAALGRKQLRLAESEKYAHVTYFFNGGREQPFDGEQRVIVPSPKVTTYDLQPEMSAAAVTEALLEALRQKDLTALVVNFANPDMVGHTGNLSATIEAVETVDRCLARVLEALDEDTALLVLSDHGNAETMRDPITGAVHKSHTTSPIRLILYRKGISAECLPPMRDRGTLIDVAPTALEILGIAKPREMTGRSLLLRAAHVSL